MTESLKPPDTAPPSPAAVAILLVDNEARNLDVLESILASPRYHLVRAQTAQEALLAVLHTDFAAIVLDIQMPGTSGLELAQLIKQRKKNSQIPILFVTAYHQEEKDILQGYEVGAADFLTKPIDPKILRSKVAVFAELAHKTRELATLNGILEAEIAQRHHVEAALQRANLELEARVQERVAALAEMMNRNEAQTRLFDTTLSSITDLAYTFDLEGNWVYANKALLELWGKPLHEITGRNSLELGYPPELAERLKQQVKEVIATRKPVRGQTYFTSASGIEDFHEYIFSPVFAADGSVSAVCGTTRLTTERKRAEAAAENHRRVLQLIAEDAPLQGVLDALARTVELQSPVRVLTSIHLVDAEGTRLLHAAGPSLSETLSRTLSDLAIRTGLGSYPAAALQRQPVVSEDILGDPLWAELQEPALVHGLRACWSAPILASQGGVLGVISTHRAEPGRPDEGALNALETAVRIASIAIERKLRDEVLRESERRYSQLVTNLPAAVYTTDARGRIMLYNEAAALLLGFRPDIGKELSSVPLRMLRPDGTPLPPELSPMTITLREGRPVRGEEILLERADGTRCTVLPYPDVIRDGSGRIVGSVNMLLDVTGTKRAEDALRRLAAIVESSDDAIVSKDLDGIITSWNRGATRLFGYSADEVIGQPILRLVPADRVEEEEEILRVIARGERLESLETLRRCKDGRLVEIWLTVSPIRDAAGRVIGASKIARDITRQKAAERELERAHQELLAASRAKDDFLAALSHELRTPLNPVLLIASESAEDPQLPEEVRDQFSKIRNGVELEARLIDDLLDITRITRGKLPLTLALVDAHTLLREALGTVQSDIRRKHIDLTLELDAGPSTIKADAVRLQQVFWNILKNAAKFTPDGGKIAVRTSCQSRPGQIVISIQDSGIGITEGEIAGIFEAFTQGEHAHSGKSHRFGGLGLGLAISKMLVDLHAGSIEAVSEGRDRGSTFTVVLPLVPMPAGDLPRLRDAPSPSRLAQESGAAPVRVLLVEDHAPTRSTLRHLLERRHFRVAVAGSVAEALACSKTADFDLLISDIGLPDGDGFGLMRQLRKERPTLQGIALTGYGLEEDVARSHDAGFICHLTKPIRIQSLDAALATAAAAAGPPPRRVSGSAP